MEDEDILKAIQGKAGSNNVDIEDELAALEEEVNGTKNISSKRKKEEKDDLSLSDISDDEENYKGKKKESKDELAKLEEEELNNLDKDIEEKKVDKTNEKLNKLPPQNKKVEINLNQNYNNKTDIYPEKPENRYHSIEKMSSLGVLQNEKELCDTIIEYKKKKKEDYDTWEIKKESIDNKSNLITATIQDGILNLDGYKKKITEELMWENKLLVFLSKDPHLKDYEKKTIKERIEKRIAIIKEELSKQVEEESEGEKEGIKEEPIKKEVTQNSTLKESVCPILEVPKEKEKEEMERLKRIVNGRLNEYRAAIDYFKTNDLSEQQGPAIQSAKKICIELKKIQDGKWKEVNEFVLPDPITPEYIYGYSSEERKKRFTKIITEMFKQKQAVQEQINQRIEACKKLGKVKLQKIQGALKKDLDSMKSKKEKYEKILSLLKLKFQDKWVPAPLYIESQEEVKIEKINKEIPENTVKIMFGKTDFKKDSSIYLIVKLLETNLEDTFNQEKPGVWTHKIEWKLEKSDFRTFYKKKIHVDVYEKRFLGLKHDLLGKCDIEPRTLRSQTEYSNKVKVKLEDSDHSFEMNIKLRQPCHETEYTTETKISFNVTKIYPPFNLNGNNTNECSIELTKVQEPKVTQEDLKINKPIPQTNVKKNNIQYKKNENTNAKIGSSIDKSQFKEEELKDPDFIDSLNSLQVLEFKLNKYEEQRAKIDGRTPRELMQKICKIKCKINILKDSFGDTITPEDYLSMLKSSFDHDKKLSEYFLQQKDKEKYKLVSERMPILIKEVEELMKQMGIKK